MKRFIFIIIYFLCLKFSFGQDTTELPRVKAINGYVYINLPYKKYIPKNALRILDSLNGKPLNLHDLHYRIVKPNQPIKKPEREITRFEYYPDGIYLLVYKHRTNSTHNHFVVFFVKNNEYFSLTTGISDTEIDSIRTLQIRKLKNNITFINPYSKNSIHKF